MIQTHGVPHESRGTTQVGFSGDFFSYFLLNFFALLLLYLVHDVDAIFLEIFSEILVMPMKLQIAN